MGSLSDLHLCSQSRRLLIPFEPSTRYRLISVTCVFCLVHLRFLNVSYANTEPLLCHCSYMFMSHVRITTASRYHLLR
ncbi:hypothetical protein BDN70DRAFT_887816 [Pholiota conissans]|uniref:Uncharacterized protein n=1 Tax=Pholiota conissans TaxID=109636 RepID=A0A9P6CS26_9AGAR|nr:hypothetical protein BDN70DRAFT_887816 [Pholiota conissans]